MAADEHDLVFDLRIGAGDLGKDVVGVAIGVEIPRADLDAQLDWQARRKHAGHHVVVLRRKDDRRLCRGAPRRARHEHRPMLAGVRADERAGAGVAKNFGDAPLIRLRSAGGRHRRCADADGAVARRRLRAIRAHESRLNGLREHDRAFEGAFERFDLVGGLIADEQRARFDHAGGWRRPALGVADERHVPVARPFRP